MNKGALNRIIFFAVTCFLLSYSLSGYEPFFSNSSNFIIFSFLFAVGYFIHIIAEKFKFRKLELIFAGGIIIVGVIWCCFMVWFLMYPDMFNTDPTTPSKSAYERNLDRITLDYTPEYFKHFPKKLPEDISDYYFFLENSFDGYDIFYLRFTKDKEYVDSEIMRKCPSTELLKEEQLPSVGHTEYISRLSSEGAKEYCIIHKSNHDIPNNSFSSGIATNSDHNTIYYFSTNY